MRIGARTEIHRLLASLLAQGAGIIMSSSCLPEVYGLADARCVFRAGRIVARHRCEDASLETILAEAIGV